MWSSRKQLTACFISIVLHLQCTVVSRAAPPPMSRRQRPPPVFPDSNELYSYKAPRTMTDLKNEHARQAMMDVTETISEVQRILSMDPSLPRLTRGEIEDLFEMVTREEYKRSLAVGDFARAKHMRSLMLVLPYNTNNADESLEDLYTRPPITKMVHSETKRPKPQRIVLPPMPVDMVAAHSDINSQRIVTTYKPNFIPNARSTHTAPVTTFHPKSTMMTQTQSQLRVNDVSTYHPNVQKQSVAVTKQADLDPPKTTMQTLGRTSLFNGNKFSSHYSAAAKPFSAPSTPAVMRPNVKDLLATIGLQPESSPLTPQSTTSVPATTFSRRVSTEESIEFTKPTSTTTTKPSTSTTTRATTTTTTTTPKPELTPELENLLKEFGLLTNEAPPSHFSVGTYEDDFQPVVPSLLRDDSLHVTEFKPLPDSLSTSLSASLAPPKPQKLTPEIRSDDFSSFKPLPIPDDVPPPNDADLEELLKSYGLLQGETTRGSKSLTADNSDGDEVKESEVEPDKIPKMMNVPEVNVAFLSPDLLRVLGDMGVKAAESETKSSSPSSTPATPTQQTTQSAKITSAPTASTTAMQNDYEKLHLLLDTIKQLDNLNANLTDDELKSLNLQNFNFSKELVSQGPDPLNEYYSYNVHKNEIKRRQSNVEDEDTSETTTVSDNAPLKLSINLPETSSTASTKPENDKKDDDSDSNATTIATDIGATDSIPTTASSDQNADDESSDGDSTTTTAPDSTSSTTEGSRNGNLKDLADSFGGDSGLDPVVDETLPAPKRNGFYFFSDWNSFLEVGEDHDKVVVRFDPKVGDSRPFVPVKIP